MDSTTNSTMKVMSPEINLAEKESCKKTVDQGTANGTTDHPLAGKVRIKAICEFLLASVWKGGEANAFNEKNNYN